MLESIVAKLFAEHGWTWNIKGKGKVVPTEDDVQAALDEAAKVLYDEQDAQLEVGRLIIRRGKTQAKDVYVYVGTYY